MTQVIGLTWYWPLHGSSAKTRPRSSSGRYAGIEPVSGHSIRPVALTSMKALLMDLVIAPMPVPCRSAPISDSQIGLPDALAACVTMQLLPVAGYLHRLW